MSDDTRDEKLSNPDVPMSAWADRPSGVTGEEARTIGRMLLDDSIPADEAITRIRRGPAALGKSGVQSPTLRFRVPAEEVAELETVAEVTHIQKSELLREGLQLVLARYRDQSAAPSPTKTRRRRHTVTLEVTDDELAILRRLGQRVSLTSAG